MKSNRPESWGSQVPPEPTHSVSTLSANRKPILTNRLRRPNRPDLFHSGSALELSPSRLYSPRRSDCVSATDPPVLFHDALRRHAQLRRIAPFEERTTPSVNPAKSCPLGVLPSEALPPAAVESASRLLLSHAYDLRSEEQARRATESPKRRARLRASLTRR
jgi:hypothetical protein